jgi:hypothetical protein
VLTSFFFFWTGFLTLSQHPKATGWYITFPFFFSFLGWRNIIKKGTHNPGERKKKEEKGYYRIRMR